MRRVGFSMLCISVVLLVPSCAQSAGQRARAGYLSQLRTAAKNAPIRHLAVPDGKVQSDQVSGGNASRGVSSSPTSLGVTWIARHPEPGFVEAVAVDAQDRGMVVSETICGLHDEIVINGTVPFGPDSGTVNLDIRKLVNGDMRVDLSVTGNVPDGLGRGSDAGPVQSQPQPAVVHKRSWPALDCTITP